MPTHPRETLKGRQEEEQQALDREKEEAARRAPDVELSAAWDALAQCTLGELGLTESNDDKARFYEEFATRLIRVAYILKTQGRLPDLAKLEGKDTALDHALNLITSAANGISASELASLLQATASDSDFVQRVGSLLRRGIRDMMLKAKRELNARNDFPAPVADSTIGPLFSEADFERAISALDICLQDYAWKPGDNYLNAGSLFSALHEKHITNALATALLRRLIDREAFTLWQQTFPAGTSYEKGCPWPVFRSEPETKIAFITSRERWYTYLNEDKRRRRIEHSGAEIVPLKVNAEEAPTNTGVPWRNSTGELFDPSIAISSIEEYLRLEKLYKDAGKPFNPAVLKGSAAAAHVIAQHERRSTAAHDEHSKVDVGIVIALDEEFRELFEQIKNSHTSILEGDTGRSFYRFERPAGNSQRPYACVATFVGAIGNTNATLVTERLLARWDPATIVMLGIAGGINKDVSIGDVVVATQVDSYFERAKTVPQRRRSAFDFELAGEVFRCTADLVNRAKHFEFANAEAHLCWQTACASRLEPLVTDETRDQLIEAKLVCSKPAFRTGHIASGPIVASAKPFVDWLKKRDRTYLAVEMEAAGFMAAVSENANSARTLILRAISDCADERKAELDNVHGGALRRYAMQNAIHLLWSLMQCDILPRKCS